MRAGLNLPIRINEKTIGVVGITGPYGQVFNYEQIKCAAKRLFIHKNMLQYKLRKLASITNRYNIDGWNNFVLI